MKIRNVRKKFLIAALCMAALSSCMNAQSLLQPLEEERPKTPEKKKHDKVSFIFRASEVSLAAATALDVATTDEGLKRPTMAYRTNDTFLMRYTVTEAGWTRCF
jgi:glycine cleavage system protein P-like pyridoxal-binding family